MESGNVSQGPSHSFFQNSHHLNISGLVCRINRFSIHMPRCMATRRRKQTHYNCYTAGHSSINCIQHNTTQSIVFNPVLLVVSFSQRIAINLKMLRQNVMSRRRFSNFPLTTYSKLMLDAIKKGLVIGVKSYLQLVKSVSALRE